MLKTIVVFLLGVSHEGNNIEIPKKIGFPILNCRSVETRVAAVFSQLPIDYYHDLHLPHDPPLYPVFEHPPPTAFSCAGRSRGYYADVDSGCQAYHFCWRQRLVSTDLCVNGTLFNEQFQVCDHFYNVRCGSPYEDL